ncbi:MAG: efflux RND transporter permease subunit [Proteobacteria bacterium]|nr:efflux RND transporter permease subunit [Pseudomonadota bacterium]NOG60336.1 efflux RND transporter permease subunit [Pseudomonadota bacterium]
MDKLIDFSLQNRLLMVLFAIMVMIAGYRAYTQLPIDAFPDVSPNLVQVFTETEGLAPEEIEMYVTYPVEVAMTGLPGIDNVRSVSNFGLSVVNVYFEDDVDIYFARQLVNERLQEAREQIPEGFGEPVMGPISTGMGLILFYYLEDTTGQYSLIELREIQDWIVKFNLQTVPGVTEILGIGGFEKQFHVEINPDALLRYSVSLHDVIERIRANNLNVGAQFIEKNSEEFIVRSVGLAKGIDDLNNIVIKTVDGSPIFLGDLADIKTGGAIRRGLQTRNGVEEVIAGMVIKLFGTNSSTVIADVEKRLGEINKILPEGIRIVPYYEQKSLVEACVKTVTDALVQGVVLVVLILLLFLGALRPSFVVAISIPFSVFFALIGMYVLDISANLMSFGGLAIAIGMMVDGGVVMIENVDRLLRKADSEESVLHIVGRACREVGRPIVFAIIIILIVFLPLFTLQGVEGKTFGPLAYTIALAMTGSLLFAIFIAPVLASFVMNKPKQKENENEDDQVLIVKWLLKIYTPLVRFFVHNRIIALIVAFVLIVVGGAIFPQLGAEFTPKLNEGTIVVRLTMAPSISLNESKRNTMLVEKRLQEVPEITKVVTRIGRGEVGAHADPTNSAEMYVILKPNTEWRKPKDQSFIEEQIREKIKNIPGIQANLTQPIKMTVDELLEGVRAELAIKVFGDDLNILKQKADDIAAVIQEVEGAADVQVDQVSGVPQLRIRPDRQAIARYGLNLEDVQNVISAAVGGVSAGQIFEGIRRFDIFVRYTPDARATKDDIRQILIETPDGVKVPLEQVALVEELVGQRQITRQNNQRFITVQSNVVGRDIVTFVEEAQQQIDQSVELPPGYLVTWGGQYRLQQEANKRLAIVIPVTLLLIFIMLYSSFNSFKNATLIFFNIPLALVGGVVALWVSGQNLSVPASVGFISLFGIALMNGIVLVTYFNQLLEKGMSIDEVSIHGACLRLRPVLMTAITTILAMIPLLLSTGTGSEVQRPLATVVVGGIVTSTILTLLVIPALYKWFAVRVESN